MTTAQTRPNSDSGQPNPKERGLLEVYELAWGVPGLSPKQRLVLLAYAKHANWNTGEAWPSNERLCSLTGYKSSSVIDAKAELVELELLTRVADKSVKRIPVYRLEYANLERAGSEQAENRSAPKTVNPKSADVRLRSDGPVHQRSESIECPESGPDTVQDPAATVQSLNGTHPESGHRTIQEPLTEQRAALAALCQELERRKADDQILLERLNAQPRHWLHWILYELQRKNIRSPVPWLTKALDENWDPPNGFVSPVAERERATVRDQMIDRDIKARERERQEWSDQQAEDDREQKNVDQLFNERPERTQRKALEQVFKTELRHAPIDIDEARTSDRPLARTARRMAVQLIEKSDYQSVLDQGHPQWLAS